MSCTLLSVFCTLLSKNPIRALLELWAVKSTGRVWSVLWGEKFLKKYQFLPIPVPPPPNTSLEGERGRFKIVSAYETSQNGKGKTRGVFFLSVYFQIGSEGSLRKISVHLPPRLHSSEHGSVRVTRSWRNNGNAQKTSCQPTLLIIFQNSILAKWAFGFIHSNDFLVHCLEEAFWQEKEPTV